MEKPNEWQSARVGWPGDNAGKLMIGDEVLDSTEGFLRRYDIRNAAGNTIEGCILFVQHHNGGQPTVSAITPDKWEVNVRPTTKVRRCTPEVELAALAEVERRNNEQLRKLAGTSG